MRKARGTVRGGTWNASFSGLYQTVSGIDSDIWYTMYKRKKEKYTYVTFQANRTDEVDNFVVKIILTID